MPFNGSGSFSPPGANYPAVANTLITAANRNAIDADFATGLSTCITKDGQTTVTANIPFAGFRLTNIGAAAARTDAARASQVQDGALTVIGSVAGTNTITGTLSPVITAYATGQAFMFVPAATNTGATTININSVGAKNIFNRGAACVGGELVISVPVCIFYDGTQFQIIGDVTSAGTFTPGLAFGGATTGITYTTQVGAWSRVGNRVDFSLTVVVNSNGTATGDATITGLPFTSRNTTGLTPIVSVYYTALAAGVATAPVGVIANNSTVVSLQRFVTGTSIAITEASVPDASDIRISGTYFV